MDLYLWKNFISTLFIDSNLLPMMLFSYLQCQISHRCWTVTSSLFTQLLHANYTIMFVEHNIHPTCILLFNNRIDYNSKGLCRKELSFY